MHANRHHAALAYETVTKNDTWQLERQLQHLHYHNYMAAENLPSLCYLQIVSLNGVRCTLDNII